MEYDQNAAYATDPRAGGAKQSIKMPELGRLKSATERVAKARGRVCMFLDKFHGPTPDGAGTDCEDSPDTYRNDLDSLFGQIERLEQAVSALEGIG